MFGCLTAIDITSYENTGQLNLLNGGQDADLIERIEFFFLGELAHFYLFFASSTYDVGEKVFWPSD